MTRREALDVLKRLNPVAPLLLSPEVASAFSIAFQSLEDSVNVERERFNPDAPSHLTCPDEPCDPIIPHANLAWEK